MAKAIEQTSPLIEQRRHRLHVRVPEHLEVDADIERSAIERYNRGIALAVAKNDNGTRELLEEKLTGEESHLDWIETQQRLIAEVGLANYLSVQINE